MEAGQGALIGLLSPELPVSKRPPADSTHHLRGSVAASFVKSPSPHFSASAASPFGYSSPAHAWRTAVGAALVASALAACGASPVAPEAERQPRRILGLSLVASDSGQFTSDSTGRGGGGYVDPNQRSKP